MDISNLLIGRRLANQEGEARKITALEGFPAMGLDRLSTSAYGPEAALTILMPAGALGLHVITPVMAAILVLAVTAGSLLTVFGGITDRLIPLFAVGAFTPSPFPNSAWPPIGAGNRATGRV